MLSALIGLSTDVVLYFLATVVVALAGGLGPALLAAGLGGVLLNFFLTPPLYSLTIGETENVVTVAAMVLVGVLVALVVDRAARRAEQAARARAEASLLASFARTVLIEDDPVPRLLEKVREGFGLRCVALLERHPAGDHGSGDPVGWSTVAVAGPADCARPEQAEWTSPSNRACIWWAPAVVARGGPAAARSRRRAGAAGPARGAGRRHGGAMRSGGPRRTRPAAACCPRSGTTCAAR